jgi:hypothetical protein
MKKRERAEGEHEEWKRDAPFRFLSDKPDRKTTIGYKSVQNPALTRDTVSDH